MKLSQVPVGSYFESDYIRHPDNPEKRIKWKVTYVSTGQSTTNVDLLSIDTFNYQNVNVSQWPDSDLRYWLNNGSFRNFIAESGYKYLISQMSNGRYSKNGSIFSVEDVFTIEDVAKTLQSNCPDMYFYNIPNYSFNVKTCINKNIEVVLENGVYVQKAAVSENNKIEISSINESGFPGFGYNREIPYTWNAKGGLISRKIEHVETGLILYNNVSGQTSGTHNFKMSDADFNKIVNYTSNSNIKITITNNLGISVVKNFYISKHNLTPGRPTFIDNHIITGEISNAGVINKRYLLKYNSKCLTGRSGLKFTTFYNDVQFNEYKLIGIETGENTIGFDLDCTRQFNSSTVNSNNVVKIRVEAVPSNSYDGNWIAELEIRFKKVAPNIVISDYDLKGQTFATPPTFYAKAVDTKYDKASISVAFKIDGALKHTATSHSGNVYAYGMSVPDWNALSKASHTLVIEATCAGVTKSVTTTFVKGDSGLLNRTKPVNCMTYELVGENYVLVNKRPKGVVVYVNSDPGVNLNVKVANNANDGNGVAWETINNFYNKKVYLFSNNSKTSSNWAVSVEVSFPRTGARKNLYGVGFTILY